MPAAGLMISAVPASWPDASRIRTAIAGLSIRIPPKLVPGEMNETRLRLVRRQVIDHVPQRRVDELAQFVAAAWGVGEHQSAYHGEHPADHLRRVRAAAPSQLRAHRLRSEAVRAEGDRGELQQTAGGAAEIISRVHNTPVTVDDESPVASIAHRRCHLGEYRISWQRACRLILDGALYPRGSAPEDAHWRSGLDFASDEKQERGLGVHS